MPHPQPYPQSETSVPDLAPVPVAVLLPPPTTHTTADGPSNWWGVAPRDLAGLIARYSQPGDLVLELDTHPTVIYAARHLGRRPSTTLVDRDGGDLPAIPAGRVEKAGLIFAALPRPRVGRRDLPATNEAMRTWRTMLRPGGYLLAALTPPSASPSMPPSPAPDAVASVAAGMASSDERDWELRLASYRALVITAARAVGLLWQQEFLVLTAPPPEYEPRAMPDTATHTPAALAEGRHRTVHTKLLAFRHETGDHSA